MESVAAVESLSRIPARELTLNYAIEHKRTTPHRYSEILKILCTEGEGRMVVPGKFVHAFMKFSEDAVCDAIRNGGQE